VLERQLTKVGTPFLTGTRVTLADILVVSSLVTPLKFSLDKVFLEQYPKTLAFITAVLNEPNVSSVYGEIKFIDKFTPPK